MPAVGEERDSSATRLRVLIAVTAAATAVVEVLNLEYADEGRYALAVRTTWALLRALGFLALMRSVRLGRQGARPFGLILAVTTVFAVARLVLPRPGGLTPPVPVLVGCLVLGLLCGVVVWQLYRSPAIERHLTRRSPRRPVPQWVLTTRIAALSYTALLLVPCLVAAGTLLAGERGSSRLPVGYAAPLVAAWFVGSVVVGWLVPWITIFLRYGKRWPRWLLVPISLSLLVVQPALCAALLGVDGLIRDGAPMVVAAGLALYGLWRTRERATGAPTRPGDVRGEV